jgi:hypothetical protein
MAEPNPPNHTRITTTNSKTDTQTNSTQNPDLPITIPGIKLNGQNYELRSQIMEIFIFGRDILGLITGKSDSQYLPTQHTINGEQKMQLLNVGLSIP